MISKKDFAMRRQQLFDQMQENSIAIVFASPEYPRDYGLYPYRQNSDFYYLTGFEEPESVAVFIKNVNETRYILFNRPRDLAKEQWIGCRAGQKGALEDFDATEAYDISELNDRMVALLNNRSALYYAFSHCARHDNKINQWLHDARQETRTGNYVPTTIINLDNILHEMRLIKSDAEIAVMRRAAAITAAAQKRAMQLCKPGMFEYQLAAELHYEYQRQGGNARLNAFDTIAASGHNACTLHYDTNKAELKNGDLVLIDSGCEYQYYAGDITRTYPVDGKFTEEQRTIYNIVLKAQLAVIEQIKPGVVWHDLQKIATRIITEGLHQIGVLKGDNVETLIARETYKKYYMHQIGHFIGLDVHDVGVYRLEGEWRALQPGMILTVEPGIYILPDDEVDKKWWNIGIRIEDDILVTATGSENLTSTAPKTVEEIEATVGTKRVVPDSEPLGERDPGSAMLVVK